MRKKAELTNFLGTKENQKDFLGQENFRKFSSETSLNKEVPFLRKGKSKSEYLLFKNKKAELENLMRIILWIIFFGIALIALYFLFRRFVW